MSLSNALSNAASGLVYASRATETVASNIANAQTPGYARRELQLSPRTHVSGGGGVQIDAVHRVVQQSVLAQQRLAVAENAGAARLAAFATDMDSAFGVPGQPLALSTALTDFDAALITASARPDSESDLLQVVSRAGDLTAKLNQLGDQIQAARTQADRDIAADVQRLNKGLSQIAELNRQISAQAARGNDATPLLDRRQAIVTDIADIVPLRELPRDNGRVALVTSGGALLLDGSEPLAIGFAGGGPINAAMQVGTPPLGRITLDGAELTAGQMSLFAGGSLAAAFAIRDDVAPGMQAQLDAFALDLHDRFADPAIDQSLSAGQPGLFTDAGVAAGATPAPGLASRLTVNAVVNPAQGGAVWRLRDGMAAATPGPTGSSALLDRMAQGLTAARVPGSAAVTPTPRTSAAFAAELTTGAATMRLHADADALRTGATRAGLDDTLRADGVDTDRELANLLNLERAYAANAKVLKAVDDMLLNILGLT